MLASIADEADADEIELVGPVNERVYDMDTGDSVDGMGSQGMDDVFIEVLLADEYALVTTKLCFKFL